MKRLELVITKQGKGLHGKCSSCSEGVFNVDVADDTPDNRDYMQRTFNMHFKTTHLREDASQAAARIVKEATENH
jgi:hypothetical protein